MTPQPWFWVIGWEGFLVRSVAYLLLMEVINQLLTFFQLRKTYIVRCVEDIKRSPAVYLPLKQLHYLAQSITKGGASYFKTEKVSVKESH